MPKKPNRKDLQNYIPAGHGDESGEYTFDGGSGGTAEPPKKEQDSQVNIKLDEIGRELGFKAENTGEEYKKVYDYISSHSTYNDEIKDYINKVFSLGDNDCNRMIANAQSKRDINYGITEDVSYCSSLGNGIYYNKEDFQASAIIPAGDAIYHENGHMVDFQNGTSLKALSVTSVSKKYGKTLHEMIGKETLNLDDLYHEMKNKKNQMINEESQRAEKALADYTETSGYKDILATEKKLMEERKQAIYGFRYDDMSADEKNRRKEEAEKKYNKLIDDHREKYKDIYNKHRELQRATFDAIEKGESNFYYEYSSVCDMLDSRDYQLGVGHYQSYWKPKGRRGAEFFAEAFTEKATGIGHLKDYFPKSYEIFEEIIKEI